MERLTEKSSSYFEYDLVNGNHLAKVFEDFDSYLNYNLAIRKLGEYEDAEEDGLLLRLPCKVGDVVYLIQSNGRITKREADMMFLGVMWDEYGKEWFTSEEEAEQTLAKMKGE